VKSFSSIKLEKIRKTVLEGIILQPGIFPEESFFSISNLYLGASLEKEMIILTDKEKAIHAMVALHLAN
jgi:hypothetical protein